MTKLKTTVIRTALLSTGLLGTSALLIACSAFLVVPGYNPYVSLDPPEIQHWQKAGSIGHTDPDQRWKDFQQCGVRKYFDGTLDMNVRYPDMTSEDVAPRSLATRSCIKNKGYIYMHIEQCIDAKNDRLTGLCN